MKIGIINSLYYPQQRGGAESIVFKQARELCNQGHEVFVICTNIKHRDTVEQINDIRVYRLAPRNIFSFFAYNQKTLWLRLVWLKLDLLNFFIARKVAEIINEEKADMVYTHNLRGLSYFVLRILKHQHINNVHTLHDIQFAHPSGLLIHGEENKWYNNIFLRKWYEAWCRYWLGSPDQVIAPSQWLLDFYTNRGFFAYSEKMVKRPFEVSGAQIVKNSYPKPISLVYVGLIESHKGILWAVEVLKKSELQFRMDIYGSGSKEKELQQTIRNDSRFNFLGQVANQRVGEIFKRADITLVPSLTYENAPTVIYESLQAGTPVLASDIGGIPEIIKIEINGWLVAPGLKSGLLSIFKKLAK